MLFLTTAGLENKLLDFKTYFNNHFLLALKIAVNVNQSLFISR